MAPQFRPILIGKARRAGQVRRVLKSRWFWLTLLALLLVSSLAIRQRRLNDALCLAASQGEVRRVEKLLKQGASPNAVGTIGFDDGCDCEDNPSPAPALILAIYQTSGNHEEYFGVVSILLKAGADVNARGDAGMTALMWAQSPQMVRLLLAHGANPNLIGDAGQTALSSAYSVQIIALLRAAGERD